MLGDFLRTTRNVGMAVHYINGTIIVTPIMGGGFFSAKAGGAMTVVASLLVHIVYGAILGAVTGKPAVQVSEEWRAA